jgi:hypothetical protein
LKWDVVWLSGNCIMKYPYICFIDDYWNDCMPHLGILFWFL